MLNWQIHVSIIKIFKIKNLNHGRDLDLIQNNVFRNVSNPVLKWGASSDGHRRYNAHVELGRRMTIEMTLPTL